MGLIKCPVCGKEISSDAGRCIHCGHPLHQAQIKQVPEKSLCYSNAHWFSYVFVGIMIFFSIGYYFMNNGINIWTIIFALIAIGSFLTFYSKSITLTNKAVYIRKGFFFTHNADIPLSQVSSMSNDQGLLGSLFNYQTVTITCAGKIFKMDMMNNVENLKNEYIKIHSGMDWRTF